MKNTSHVWTSSNLQALGAPDVVLRGDPFRLATLGFAVQASDGTVENYGWGSSLIWLYGCNMVETKKNIIIKKHNNNDNDNNNNKNDNSNNSTNKNSTNNKNSSNNNN